MRRSTVCLVASGAAVLAALALWRLTGSHGYTRWPDDRLTAADAPAAAGEQELLDEIGFATGIAPAVAAQSRFAFGLVPGGFDPPHLLSVATVVLAALMACVAVAMTGRLTRRPHPGRNGVLPSS